jgi:hypothetical protein
VCLCGFVLHNYVKVKLTWTRIETIFRCLHWTLKYAHVLSWRVCTFRAVIDVHSQGHSEVFEAMGLTFSQDMITREYEHILKRGGK